MPKKKVPKKKVSKKKVPKKKKATIVQNVTSSADFIERRRAARLDIPLKLNYTIIEDDDLRGGVTKNVSAGGCLLLVSDEIPIETRLELELFLGSSEAESLKLIGRVVRLNREEGGVFEYGISFDDIGREARRLFADFCFAKMYEMIGLSDWPTERQKKEEK